MEKIKIKRIKKQEKPVTAKQKILAGLGVGATILGPGLAGAAKPQQPIIRTMGNNNQTPGAGNLLEKIWQKTFGIETAQAANLATPTDPDAPMVFTGAAGTFVEDNNAFIGVGSSVGQVYDSQSNGTFGLDPSAASNFVSTNVLPSGHPSIALANNKFQDLDTGAIYQQTTSGWVQVTAPPATIASLAGPVVIPANPNSSAASGVASSANTNANAAASSTANTAASASAAATADTQQADNPTVSPLILVSLKSNGTLLNVIDQGNGNYVDPKTNIHYSFDELNLPNNNILNEGENGEESLTGGNEGSNSIAPGPIVSSPVTSTANPTTASSNESAVPVPINAYASDGMGQLFLTANGTVVDSAGNVYTQNTSGAYEPATTQSATTPIMEVLASNGQAVTVFDNGNGTFTDAQTGQTYFASELATPGTIPAPDSQPSGLPLGVPAGSTFNSDGSYTYTNPNTGVQTIYEQNSSGSYDPSTNSANVADNAIVVPVSTPTTSGLDNQPMPTLPNGVPTGSIYVAADGSYINPITNIIYVLDPDTGIYEQQVPDGVPLGSTNNGDGTYTDTETNTTYALGANGVYGPVSPNTPLPPGVPLGSTNNGDGTYTDTETNTTYAVGSNGLYAPVSPETPLPPGVPLGSTNNGDGTYTDTETNITYVLDPATGNYVQQVPSGVPLGATNNGDGTYTDTETNTVYTLGPNGQYVPAKNNTDQTNTTQTLPDGVPAGSTYNSADGSYSYTDANGVTSIYTVNENGVFALNSTSNPANSTNTGDDTNANPVQIVQNYTPGPNDNSGGVNDGQYDSPDD